MNWAQEQVLKAANSVLDYLIKTAVTDIQMAGAQNLYYQIQNYKYEVRRAS